MEHKKYLKELHESDKAGFDFVSKHIALKFADIQSDSVGNCCGDEPTGTTPTLNGNWVCNPDNCKYYWVPEIG
jgi:hypothetical protein